MSGIQATINAQPFMTSGYEFTCLINGQDADMKPGRWARRFTQDHPMRQKMSDLEEAKRVFCLKEGLNDVEIHYRKLKEGDLSILFEIAAYPAPLFYAYAKTAPSGTFKGQILIAKTPPDGFKPIYFADQPPGRSGFLYIRSRGCDVFSTLNGQRLIDMQGLPGPVPLENLHPGANRLELRYSCAGPEIHLAIVGPKAVDYVDRLPKGEQSEIFTVEGY